MSRTGSPYLVWSDERSSADFGKITISPPPSLDDFDDWHSDGSALPHGMLGRGRKDLDGLSRRGRRFEAKLLR